MKYIEHDRKNCSVRTLSEAAILLHYGSEIASVIHQDGSIHLSNAIDIYADDCYSQCCFADSIGDKNAMHSLQ